MFKKNLSLFFGLRTKFKYSAPLISIHSTAAQFSFLLKYRVFKGVTSISEFHLRGNANVRNGGARVGGKITDWRGICLSFGIYEISCLWKI